MHRTCRCGEIGVWIPRQINIKRLFWSFPTVKFKMPGLIDSNFQSNHLLQMRSFQFVFFWKKWSLPIRRNVSLDIDIKQYEIHILNYRSFNFSLRSSKYLTFQTCLTVQQKNMLIESLLDKFNPVVIEKICVFQKASFSFLMQETISLNFQPFLLPKVYSFLLNPC